MSSVGAARGLGLSWGLAFAVAGCGCAQHSPTKDTSVEVLASSQASVDPPAAAPEAPVKPRTAEEKELEEWIAAYQRGEVSSGTDDARVRYTGTARRDCVALPEARPVDFELQLSQQDHDRGHVGFRGLSSSVCTFEWDMLGLDAPPGTCTLLAPQDFDTLYARLRELKAWTIRSRSMERTPHSSGITLVMRWAGGRCELQDVHGWSVVVDADEARWTDVMTAVRSYLR